MFDKHRAKVAAEAYAKALGEWQGQRDGMAELIQTAETFEGVASNDVMLRDSERLFLTVAGAALVGERRLPGQWKGKSQGFSIPVASIGGRSIRYRTGTSRGHIVQGAVVPAAVDTGTVFVTNQRVIFEGNKQTRECLFAKLIGFQHDADGSTTFSVSNRQKPTTIHYGPEAAPTFDFRFDLGLAHFRSEVPALVQTLQGYLAQIDATRPFPPAALPA